jgi:hypothetical protein
MGEGVGDAERGIDLEQDVGDPHGRHSTIEIQYQLFSVVGNVRRQSVDPQGAIFYAAVGDGSVAGCPGVQGGDKLGHWSAVMLAVRAE